MADNGLSNFTIIPANPGFYIIYKDESKKEFFVDTPIIAWRVETELLEHDGSYFTICYPIITEGDPVPNYFAILNPDGSINTKLGESFPYYESLLEDYRDYSYVTREDRMNERFMR